MAHNQNTAEAGRIGVQLLALQSDSPEARERVVQDLSVRLLRSSSDISRNTELMILSALCHQLETECDHSNRLGLVSRLHDLAEKMPQQLAVHAPTLARAKAEDSIEPVVEQRLASVLKRLREWETEHGPIQSLDNWSTPSAPEPGGLGGETFAEYST